MEIGRSGIMEIENLKETFLETLNDLNLSISFLRDKKLLGYEVELLANRCKISQVEVHEVLEKAKQENWSWRKK